MKTTTNIDQSYQHQREKNNIAVRKSREKSRQKIKETKERVARLKRQNVELTNQLELLNRELSFLKELFQTQMANDDKIEVKEVPFLAPLDGFEPFETLVTFE